MYPDSFNTDYCAADTGLIMREYVDKSGFRVVSKLKFFGRQ